MLLAAQYMFYRFDSKFQEAVDGMKELNKLISSSEMDQTHNNSSPAGSDISINTMNEELEVSSLCAYIATTCTYITVEGVNVVDN